MSMVKIMSKIMNQMFLGGKLDNDFQEIFGNEENNSANSDRAESEQRPMEQVREVPLPELRGHSGVSKAPPF